MQLNREILAHSLALQRQLPPLTHGGVFVGGQQAMPHPNHAHLFGPENPLPWVPDPVAKEFGNDPARSVLVVGSAYAPFIEEYSQRHFPLEIYLRVRSLLLEAGEDPGHGLTEQALNLFSNAFNNHVIEGDRSYYFPVFHQLLAGAGVPRERTCLTDLCKASFVANHRGGDAVVRRHFEEFCKYVLCPPRFSLGARIPDDWIWRRLQQTRNVVALGTIVEYGVLKIFGAKAAQPRWSTRRSPGLSLLPKHLSSIAWEYRYADRQRTLKTWLHGDWWVLRDESNPSREWRLLPVYHPSRRPKDQSYTRSAAVLKAMLT